MPEEPRSSVQDLLGAAGAPPVVSHAGRDYPLVADQAAAARYERLVAQWATDAVLALKGDLPAEVYADTYADLRADLKARKHARGGSLWQQATQSADSDALFLAALMGVDWATAVAAMDADPDRVRLALVEAIPDFLALLLRGMGATPGEIRAKAAAALAARGFSAGSPPGR
jgi:hypothetical protein